jgi:6-pyruvoyltetrahydropterin/6-carboxytetrahydropterin synthase
MTTTIRRRYHFEAAHRLPKVPPEHRCFRMHGHNYEIEIVVSGALDDRGFVADFAELDSIVMPIVARCDHRVLNDVPGLENPTAEIIAAWFLGQIENACSLTVDSVCVFETKHCSATVTK